MSQSEMNAKRSTITLHMVSSLDGFIARKDNTVLWLDGYPDVYEKGVSEDGADEVLEAIDCYVLGSRTYEHAPELGWPYGDTPTVVTTKRELPSTRKRVEFYSGAMLCESFLRLGLVDEIRLMIAPILLGEGLRLFGNSGFEHRWRLRDVVAHKNGFVE